MSLLHSRCDAEIAYLRGALTKERERNEELTKLLATMADPLAQARVVAAERTARAEPAKAEKQAPARRVYSPAFLRKSDKHAQRPDPSKWLTPPQVDAGQPPPFNNVEAQFVRHD